MNYIEYKFELTQPDPWRDVLVALLSECEFESFVEQAKGLDAYVRKDLDDEEEVKQRIRVLRETRIDYQRKEIEQENWNAEWESNFSPILVNDKCLIRAEFHDSLPDIEYDLVIQPKMSFGTGHHATTHLMVEYILNNDFQDKEVLDMGCGTSVLAILAKKKGAGKTLGIDIDEWAVENSIENAERNSVDIRVIQGDVSALDDTRFDVILANINKNILIADIPAYANVLKENGDLYVSGILENDFNDVMHVCEANGLKFVEVKQRNEWIAIHVKK